MGNRYIVASSVAVEESPQACGRDMAEDSSLPGGENRRHPLALSVNRSVPECVDAGVETVKAVHSQAIGDGVLAEP